MRFNLSLDHDHLGVLMDFSCDRRPFGDTQWHTQRDMCVHKLMTFEIMFNIGKHQAVDPLINE